MLVRHLKLLEQAGEYEVPGYMVDMLECCVVCVEM